MAGKEAVSVAPIRPVRRRPALVGVGLAALALLLLGGLVLAHNHVPGAAARPQAVTRLGAAPAPTPGGVMMPDEGRNHVNPGVIIPYKHYPPTSGTHYYVWGPLGVYPAKKFPHPLPEGYWVHNLEHGAIVVLYHCPKACPAVVKKLTGLMKAFPKDKFGQVKALITPYAHMKRQIAILSWRWLDQMDTFNLNRLIGFYRLHVNHGPEDIGPDAYVDG